TGSPTDGSIASDKLWARAPGLFRLYPYSAPTGTISGGKLAAANHSVSMRL
ncbi:unnamed protein product, partial [marine sediment metagenome]